MALLPTKVSEFGSSMFDFGMGNFAGYIPYLLYFLILIGMMGIAGAVYWIMIHKFRVSEIPLFGSGNRSSAIMIAFLIIAVRLCFRFSRLIFSSLSCASFSLVSFRTCVLLPLDFIAPKGC